MMEQENQTYPFSDADRNHFHIFTNYFAEMLSRHRLEDGLFTYVSPSAINLINVSPEELYHHTFYDFIHPDDVQGVQMRFLNPYEHSGKVLYRLRRKEGDYIWVETDFVKGDKLASDMDFDEGECFCVTRDVAHFKIAEEDVKISEEKYRTLVEHFHDTIGILTSSGNIVYLNESGKKLFGITRTEEVIGKSLLDFIAKGDAREEIAQTIRMAIENRKPCTVRDITLIRTDRDTKDVDMSFIPTFYKNRHKLQIVMTDVTVRKKTEERLQQAEKLSVVGQLAAGIAHEIRNPLTAIKGFTQLIKEQINPEYCSVILQELDRIETIVSDLLVLAKPQVVKAETVDIVKLIKSTVTLLNSQAILQNIIIKFHPEVEKVELECEPDQLKQVFINILRNAMEAMPDGGPIHIYLKQSAKEVDISFVDQGVGIPKDRLQRIGEPFYSTKEKGTGLGLMICQKIIKNHKGHLKIESEVGQGTTITVALPRKTQKENQV
jgi:two-component system sporulation sensor kinase A